MVNWQSRKLGDLLLLANGVVAIVLINLLASFFFFRLDLTEEKRFSLKKQTKDILKNLDDRVYVEVYLDGELNPGFTRFRKAIAETLEEFRIYSGNRINYTFIDPGEASGKRAQGEFMADLASRGIQPINVIDTREGQRVEKIIFPGAVVSYGGMEEAVMLLRGSRGEEDINQSIEGIEFEFANTIYQLTNLERKQVGMVRGHDELDSLQITSFVRSLSELYDVYDVRLEDKVLTDFDALIIAKPRRRFSDADKYALDQYIMHGGKVLFLLDKLEASTDSASQKNYFAFPYELELDDMLFRYGVRINMDLIQDRNAGFYPVVTGQSGSRPQIQLLEWPFFPLINRYADHPVTRNLDAVVGKFVSSIDTVKADGVKKTPLMFTSQYSRTLTAPVNIDIDAIRKEPPLDQFTDSFIPVAFLLEGRFSSVFKNRFLPEGTDRERFRDESMQTRIIIISDGDMARNEINPRTGKAHQLGFDQFTNVTFANRELLMNMIAFLTEDDGLIQTRTKQVTIRPLDRERINKEKLKWQTINLVIPVAMVIVFGIARSFWRKRKYASFE